MSEHEFDQEHKHECEHDCCEHDECCDCGGHEHNRDRRQAGFLAALGILQVLPHADEIAALGMAHREKKTGLKPEENLSLLRVISRQYMLKHTPSVQFPPQSSLL